MYYRLPDNNPTHNEKISKNKDQVLSSQPELIVVGKAKGLPEAIRASGTKAGLASFGILAFPLHRPFLQDALILKAAR